MTTDEPQPAAPHPDAEAGGAGEPAAALRNEPPRVAEKKRAANGSQSIRNLWIGVGGLAFLLILSMLAGKRPGEAAAPAGGADLAAMRAEVESLQAELNRQLAELDLPPLASQGEDPGVLTTRIRKDTDALIAMLEQARTAAADKDRLLTEKSRAFIESEKVRESLSAELARVQANSARNAEAEQEVTAALTRANRLADELAVAREMITELSAPQDNGELESLRQRLEEATRARDFFEQRALELEKALSTPDGPAIEEAE